MANPFLEVGDFETQFGRDLSVGESAVAERLLQVVSDWIRDKVAPTVLADDDLRAQQVVFEVVRDALNYGGYERLSQYTNTTNTRTESATFNAALIAVVEDYLTNSQKRLLGIPLSGGPVYCFPKCDY